MKINKQVYISIIVILAFIITIWTLVLTSKSKNPPYSDKVFYYRLDDSASFRKPSYDIFEIMNDVAEYSGVKLEKSKKYSDTNFVSFLSLDHIDRLIIRVNYPMSCTHIYGICGSDQFASKSALYETMCAYLPKNVINDILPITYSLESKKDKKLLENKTEDENIVYIAKKNVQRQEGFKIFKDPKTPLDEDFVVVQEMLQDPYIIDDRKINIRVYLLISIFEETVNFYVYKDGFVYYTPDKFEKYTTDFKKTVTTGYIDRNVYENNPLTLKDLERHMGDQNYKKMFDHTLYIVSCFKKVYSPILLEKNRHIRCKKFLIYGIDIAPSQDLKCKLIEINKGPDLTYKDDRDKDVKFNLVKNSLEIVGLIQDSLQPKNYIKI